MNQKQYSLLLCALLASTLVHEIHAKAASKPAFAPQMLKKIADHPLKSDMVRVDLTPKLSVMGNVDLKHIGVANLLLNAGIIIDVPDNGVAILNGNTGAATFINMTTLELVHFGSGVWLSLETDFQSFLNNLTPRWSSRLIKTGGIVSQVADVPPAVLREVNEVAACLIANIVEELANNPLAGLEIILVFSTKEVAWKLGMFAPFFDVIGTTVLSTGCDLPALLSMYYGYEQLVERYPGGLSPLFDAGLDLQVIFDLPSGPARLASLLRTIGTQINIVDYYGDRLNNNKILLRFCSDMGGNVNTGITGLTKYMATILEYKEGDVPMVVPINVLFQVLAFTSRAPAEDLSALVKETVADIQDAAVTGNVTSLTVFMDTLSGFEDGTLSIDGWNLSAILDIVATNVYNGPEAQLQIPVMITQVLASVLDSDEVLSYILFVLILNTNNPLGLRILEGLGIPIERGIIPEGSIIADILETKPNIDVTLRRDIFEGLLLLPIIGDVVAALDNALAIVTQGDLESIVKSYTPIQDLINALFQMLGGLALSATTDTMKQAADLLRNCTSVSFHYSMDQN